MFSRDEVKYLLPKPVLPMKEIKPPQWVEMVQAHWNRMLSISNTEAKAQCLNILQRWALFGSCFFSVKWMRGENSAVEQILALNREGVHFLDVQSHVSVPLCDLSRPMTIRHEA